MRSVKPAAGDERNQADRDRADRDRADRDQAAANQQTASLAGLAITLLLVILAFGVMKVLTHNAAIEDCVMMGRTNCLPVQGATR